MDVAQCHLRPGFARVATDEIAVDGSGTTILTATGINRREIITRPLKFRIELQSPLIGGGGINRQAFLLEDEAQAVVGLRVAVHIHRSRSEIAHYPQQ